MAKACIVWDPLGVSQPETIAERLLKKKKKKSREKVCEMSAITADLELTQVGSF